MNELKTERELVQTKIDGRVFRFCKRFYQGGPEDKVLGVVRVLDGPQNLQGFYVANHLDQKVHLPECLTWSDMEAMLERSIPPTNGGQ